MPNAGSPATNGCCGTKARGESYSVAMESEGVEMLTDSLYSDAQWHWIADRVGEGYLMKDISAFLDMHPNNIRYNLCRIGRRLDYVTLDDLNDMKDEFVALANTGPSN